MKAEIYWLIIWLGLASILGSVIIVCSITNSRHYEAMAEKGYEREALPSEYTRHWIKVVD